MTGSIGRDRVLAFRVAAQQLERASGDLTDTALLDLGVQDTGPDGGRWALAIRGVDVAAMPSEALVTVWSLRGAPHLYRRADLPSVAAALEPYSDADAGKRVFDASRPLKAAGIPNLVALDRVAAAQREIVTGPMVKGEVSSRLTDVLEAPYLRFCRACDATHVYEQPFRLAALRAGLELRPGSSPPVLEPIPHHRVDRAAQPRHDLVRGCLALLGPTTPQQVAAFLDAPVRDVKARWPADIARVTVGGEPRWVLEADRERLGDAPPPRAVRLLGPYDLFLQGRDRALLVADRQRAKALWPVIGRPGAVLAGGEVVGLWRPRASGARLSLRVELWATPTERLRAAVHEQAERLAAFRGRSLAAVQIEEV